MATTVINIVIFYSILVPYIPIIDVVEVILLKVCRPQYI